MAPSEGANKKKKMNKGLGEGASGSVPSSRGQNSRTESPRGGALWSSLILLPPTTETGKGHKCPSRLERQTGKHSGTPREYIHGPSTHQEPVVCLSTLSFLPSGLRRRGIIIRGKGTPGGGKVLLFLALVPGPGAEVLHWV